MLTSLTIHVTHSQVGDSLMVGGWCVSLISYIAVRPSTNVCLSSRTNTHPSHHRRAQVCTHERTQAAQARAPFTSSATHGQSHKPEREGPSLSHLRITWSEHVKERVSSAGL